ncbi:SMC-Scp complex subunit ScpB [Methanimicrococcus blatticola]|uniref:Condensin subunit ScpB n=1 Tax=Methanimicrococcus blatticola TaxID=91560 RepID=A0A484F7T0_9EURY|nr:SMC-Scp complex subunit ScpB [Methanimicrococcus blatticola]MBZ3935031.1 SMC-Scp complex subunit ScpB [Methanimicrococcus blatticola]MCC2508872.1 SMC-Scp complex subunit ScpB [Methanimicrococcus blatticola]TDQ71101.1 condensin subunit ScpB [Methanimicrococcus blatticola]
MTEENTAKQIIEAALFAAGSTVTAETLMKISGLSKKEITRLVAELKDDYAARGSGIEIADLAGRFVMQIKPEFAEKVKDVAPKELTSPQLKTLSIIAYHQPITKAEVVEMRGGNAYDHINELYERGLIDLKPHGRTKMMTTTKLFAEYFGIASNDSADVRNKMVEIYRAQGGQSDISSFASRKRLAVTEMYESLMRMCGITNYKVVNPYQPSENDLQILEETDVLVMAKGYADKLRENNPPYGGTVLEMSSTTFSDLIEDIHLIEKELGEDFTRFGKLSKKEENLNDLKELQEIYRNKALMVKSKASPATEMSAKILGELGIGLSVDGVVVSPDYGTSGSGKKVKKGEVSFPTHKSQSGNLIKRVCEKYDAVIGGLREIDKSEKADGKKEQKKDDEIQSE